ARDNRGWIKKLFDPEAGNDTIAEWTSTRDKRQQELDELRQRQEVIEAETAQIDDKLADIEREARPMEKEHALLCLYGEIVDPLVWKMVAPRKRPNRPASKTKPLTNGSERTARAPTSKPDTPPLKRASPPIPTTSLSRTEWNSNPN